MLSNPYAQITSGKSREKEKKEEKRKTDLYIKGCAAAISRQPKIRNFMFKMHLNLIKSSVQRHSEARLESVVCIQCALSSSADSMECCWSNSFLLIFTTRQESSVINDDRLHRVRRSLVASDPSNSN